MSALGVAQPSSLIEALFAPSRQILQGFDEDLGGSDSWFPSPRVRNEATAPPPSRRISEDTTNVEHNYLLRYERNALSAGSESSGALAPPTAPQRWPQWVYTPAGTGVVVGGSNGDSREAAPIIPQPSDFFSGDKHDNASLPLSMVSWRDEAAAAHEIGPDRASAIRHSVAFMDEEKSEFLNTTRSPHRGEDSCSVPVVTEADENRVVAVWAAGRSGWTQKRRANANRLTELAELALPPIPGEGPCSLEFSSTRGSVCSSRTSMADINIECESASGDRNFPEPRRRSSWGSPRLSAVDVPRASYIGQSSSSNSISSNRSSDNFGGCCDSEGTGDAHANGHRKVSLESVFGVCQAGAKHDASWAARAASELARYEETAASLRDDLKEATDQTRKLSAAVERQASSSGATAFSCHHLSSGDGTRFDGIASQRMELEEASLLEELTEVRQECRNAEEATAWAAAEVATAQDRAVWIDARGAEMHAQFQAAEHCLDVRSSELQAARAQISSARVQQEAAAAVAAAVAAPADHSLGRQAAAAATAAIDASLRMDPVAGAAVAAKLEVRIGFLRGAVVDATSATERLRVQADELEREVGRLRSERQVVVHETHSREAERAALRGRLLALAKAGFCRSGSFDSSVSHGSTGSSTLFCDADLDSLARKIVEDLIVARARVKEREMEEARIRDLSIELAIAREASARSAATFTSSESQFEAIESECRMQQRCFSQELIASKAELARLRQARAEWQRERSHIVGLIDELHASNRESDAERRELSDRLTQLRLVVDDTRGCDSQENFSTDCGMHSLDRGQPGYSGIVKRPGDCVRLGDDNDDPSPHAMEEQDSLHKRLLSLEDENASLIREHEDLIRNVKATVAPLQRIYPNGVGR
eukprot:TRINITY_DN11597_c0_g1_i1.p1 TRINITY_DN11597_c0_g1~~TRINITY_DN11597_c0_g1_i1.p1  ORF type:complete len:885 (+),score=167.52 TRINITY_DN11597_c0_g1_i1:244-2898(+)